MKKIISLILSLAVYLSLVPSVFAADYTEVIPCKYARVGDFSDGLAAVAMQVGTDKNGNGIFRWGFIDKAGKEVIPCQYVYPGGYYPHQNPRFSEDMAAVVIDDGITEHKIRNYCGKYCFIDKTGKEIIPGKYDTASDFSEGLAMVGVWDGTTQYIPEANAYIYNFDCGFIDKTGKEVVPLKYDAARDFSEGLAAVRVGNDSTTWEWGFIDQTGKEVISPRCYRLVKDFSEGLVAVMDQNGKWGFIDKSGKEVIPCQYTSVGDFSEGLAAVHMDDGYGFIDKTGNVVIHCPYVVSNVDGAYPGGFSEGLAAVQMDDGYGFIDKTGKEVFTVHCNFIKNFSEGLAVKCYVGKYGYIDKTGNEVVPCQYAWACPVSEGMAAVAIKGETSGAKNFKWGFISVGGAQPPVPTVGNFTDVKTGDYFAEPVLWAIEKGITAGTSATTFSPNQNCTVAQILTFLWRANGSPKPSGSNPFSDVKSGDYYTEAAIWAYEEGMVSGKTFNGNTPCTRSMAVTYMWKAAGSPSAKAASFTDVPTGAEYASAVAWAVEQGVTAGTSATTFSPDSVCTRGQIATFLYRGLAK